MYTVTIGKMYTCRGVGANGAGGALAPPLFEPVLKKILFLIFKIIPLSIEILSDNRSI